MRNDATITFRLPHEEKDRWTEAAKKEGVELSAWIRSQCAAEDDDDEEAPEADRA